MPDNAAENVAGLVSTAAESTGDVAIAAYKGAAAVLVGLLDTVESVASMADVPIDLTQKTVHEVIAELRAFVAGQS